MTAKLSALSFAFSAWLTALPAAAAVPVHLTGYSAANEELRADIVQTITYFGAAFDCPAPTSVKASRLNSSMVPPALRKPSLKTAYEEWDAIFCGKTYRFFVTFAPDPKGGSFLTVEHPYPPNAPSGM